MSGAARAGTFWQHLRSWRFLATLVALELVKFGVGRFTPVERATLGGFDSIAYWANRLYPPDTTAPTVVVGITADDVERIFSGRRPVPPAAVVGVVRELMKLQPSVLVVDIFTEDTTYRRRGLLDPLYAYEDRLVWARAVDTTTAEILPLLGNVRPAPGSSGIATVLLDSDLLARRFRPRFATQGTEAVAGGAASLPLAAVQRCQVLAAPACARAPDIAMHDTGSVALRAYPRDPPMYVLGDVLAAAGAPSTDATPLAGKIVVLGFVDGSDQVATPWGIREGPYLVADAIQTLLDRRGVVRALPFLGELGIDVFLAVFVAWLYFHLRPPHAALALLTLAVATYGIAVFAFARWRMWSDPIFIIVGIWLEQLYEDVSGSAPHATPAAASETSPLPAEATTPAAMTAPTAAGAAPVEVLLGARTPPITPPGETEGTMVLADPTSSTTPDGPPRPGPDSGT